MSRLSTSAGVWSLDLYFFNFSVGGLVNGAIKVFNASSGSLMGVLDNEEVVQDAMPISRVRSENSISV